MAETRTIRLSRKLLLTHSWFRVLGVLQHEMAHQVVDEILNIHTDRVDAHGSLFKQACEMLGVPNEFTKASLNLQQVNLDWRDDKRDETAEKMLDKVRKLLALATSSNEHEALSAMKRVREIYARHSLEQVELEDKSQFRQLVIPLNSKRIETYQKKIMGILVGHFFVQVIASQSYDVALGKTTRSLEIIGTRESVLMAEYVYYFLMQQSQNIQDKEITSRVSRSSYRLGLLQGFSEKLSSQENQQKNPDTNVLSKALVKFESNPHLKEYVGKIYPRLRSLSSATKRIDSTAYYSGHEVGKQITLNKPISSAGGFLGRLLGK